ncbi:unnamed protein product [Nezara viridula]|uniref:Uncharacterized protein n=1 Tax=Nezara viridula TaxID=85310 RepID=A0A9P0E535_NEZVI|nr:unnamed protein product [Nezara viridula]
MSRSSGRPLGIHNFLLHGVIQGFLLRPYVRSGEEEEQHYGEEPERRTTGRDCLSSSEDGARVQYDPPLQFRPIQTSNPHHPLYATRKPPVIRYV